MSCLLCPGSKLTNFQGWKEILTSLEKQEVELLACMWSGCAHWNHGKCLPASIKEQNTWWIVAWETEFCCPPPCSPWFHLMEHWGTQETKNLLFPDSLSGFITFFRQIHLSNVLTITGFSNLAGTRRKSPATSSICAGYFSYSKFYYSNYTILFHQSNRDLIFLRK